MEQEQAQAHQPIAHVNIGDTFSGVYYVESVFTKKTKQNKDYQDFTIRDKSGSRVVKYWGTVDGVVKGDFVFVAANVEDYMGSPSIIAKNIQKEEIPTDMSEYLPTFGDFTKYAESFDKIKEFLRAKESETGDDLITRIVDEVYNNGAFFNKFVKSPGSARPHYGREGGLFANTVTIAEQCIKMSESYDMNGQEISIMIASSLLCRIGAIDAFEFKDCMPVETKKGILLGINNLTMTRIASALKRVVSELSKNGKVCNQDIIIRLFHAVSSCDDKCLKPMTKEAMILSSIYRMNSQMVDAIEFINNDVNTNEEFTAYDPTLGRRYYTGCKTLV